MMLAYRFVRLMEANADALVAGLLDRVAQSDRCPAYRQVPPDDLRNCIAQVYPRLGEWLLGKTEFDIERRYRDIGARRASQGVPMSQMAWVIALMKENLLDFLSRQAQPSTPGELMGELRVLQLIDQFFGRATYYALLGHEECARQKQATTAGGN